MASPKAAMKAKSIGHYILGKTIGEGTFGKVKLGTHILTGEKVAVKILEKERIVDVADVERVAREIHILKLVQHPHVIQLYEIIETPRQLYLIMEYCNGGELFDHIVQNGRVREREACRFFHQILGGVEQIHRMNVVHRDLKPENLLLDDQKCIKIVDFGLSNTFQEGQLLKTACGSPCYAAPEMIAGQRYVPSNCDIWSCGVILFALVCGYLPFEDQNTSALYRKILNADYQAPKFISETVRDLIARMLNTDPEARYTVPRIRAHAWYRQIPEAALQHAGERGDRRLEDDVLEQLERFGFPRDYATKCLQMCKHNHVTTTYYLLVEKKKRLGGHLGSAPMGEFEAFAQGRNAARMPQEIELQMDMQDSERAPKQGSEIPVAAADADRAAGGHSQAPAPPYPPKAPDSARANYGSAWAQAIGTPGGSTVRESTSQQRGDSSYRQGAESLEPDRLNYPSSPSHIDPSRYGVAPPTSARGTRRISDNQTPRGSGAAAVAAQRRPAPPQVPVPPIGIRSRTPGRRPLGGLDEQDMPVSRPGTSQGLATPARPPGPPSARSYHANEARRRQFVGGAATPEVGELSSTSRGSARPSSQGRGIPVQSAAATAAAVAADLYGHDGEAWGQSRGAALRASSATPEIAFDMSQGGAPGAPPLSARDARDEAMRTCRGAFNVSCTSSKAPRQIMQEIQRALGIHRVTFKQASAFLVRCQKQGLRFEMEISHLDHLESIYVVRFRRAAGELALYKDMCSKVLAEMKM